MASTHRRRGTLITDRGVLDPTQQLSALRRAAAVFVATVRLLNIDRTTAQEAIDEALAHAIDTEP